MFDNYPDLLDFKGFKRILNIGDSLAYKLLQTDQVKHIKIGNSYRIRKQDVVDYINQNVV